MPKYIDYESIKASADFFREHSYRKPEQIGLFFYFKSLGMNSLFSCDYPKWGDISKDKKREYLRTLYDLSANFDITSEAGEKNCSIFPFSITTKGNYKNETFYNAASAFQTIGSRVTDTLNNSLVDTFITRLDSVRLIFADNYIEIIKEYLNGQKIPLKHLTAWFLKFWDLEFDDILNSEDYENVCLLKFLKFFHILPKEFDELFIYDENTNIRFADERIKGDKLREIIGSPDTYAPEIRSEPRREYMPQIVKLTASETVDFRSKANTHLTHDSIRNILIEWNEKSIRQNHARYASEMADGILKRNLFGIHIQEKNTALSESQPHICIGWSKLGDLSEVQTYDALANLYDSLYDRQNNRSRGQDLGQIWRFTNTMQKGDFIIYANGSVCHIGLVISDYYFDDTENNDEFEDYKNKRDVIWLKRDIQRNSLSAEFHRSLSTSMSLWTMNDYRAAVFDLLKGSYNKDEIDVQSDADDTVENYKSQKEKFRGWMADQKKDDGMPYSQNTINSYISQMERGYSAFNQFKEYASPFEIVDEQELSEYTKYLFNADGWNEFNDRAGNRACEYGYKRYGDFLRWQSGKSKLVFNTGFECSKPRNRIFFGAPGTGKSYTLNNETETLVNDKNGYYERVTFHPDYSYSQFVGAYKPVPTTDENNNSVITYSYVPGPFMRTLAKALENAMKEPAAPHILVVEEINRANVAAVFGDVFQLLDRDEKNCSQYAIHTSEDMRKYLAERLNISEEDCAEIKIPDNMFIWATMNSADQGVFPMDTAFKRRWDFTYLGIDENEEGIRGKYVTVGSNEKQRIEWNSLRKAINDFLANEKINEDKQLGPYFISRSIVVPADGGTEIDSTQFIRVFKNKVLMYLFDDAAKQKRTKLFEGCMKGQSRYSKICEAFDEQGIGIFNPDIRNRVVITDFPSNDFENNENGSVKISEQ